MAERYTVGKKYLFIEIKHTPADVRFDNLYRPWCDKLDKLEVVELTCTEHHKVAWDQDPDQEKKYDGFVFTDGTGQVWHNQYPNASYGQLDNSMDWMVVPEWDRARAEADREFLFMQMHDAGQFMGPINRGIQEFLVSPGQTDKSESLLAFRTQILEKIIALDYRVRINSTSTSMYSRDEDGSMLTHNSTRIRFSTEIYKTP